MTELNHANITISAIRPVSDVITIGVNQGVKAGTPNNTASIRYYSNSDGTPAVPSSGTVTVSATSLASGQDTPIADGELDATDITDYVDWKHHCTKVTATPLGIVAATHYQLFLVQDS